MNEIPDSIENSLREAGFTPSEIIILRRVIEHEALTLRELAARTGKSTGVLDEAMKKLLRKGVVKKELINNLSKYALVSLDVVRNWMSDDVRRKREMLDRRHQNFEAFIQSVQKEKKRPEMEFFDGIEGLAQAYRKLLSCGKELLMYVPVFCSIEDDPLRDFKVEWFRTRRKAGIFSRVIAHNTPLGRRHQSRDPFEYRQTLLVDETEMPFSFEKIIMGDTIACLNFAEKRACLLKYPELAAMERGIFETHWRQLQQKAALENQKASSGTPDSAAAPVTKPIPAEKVTTTAVPLNVRTFSGLREFFLSRKSIAAFCAIAVLSGFVTVGLYQYTQHLQFKQMQETVKSIAATGAFQFDAKDLDALQVEADWKKPEWAKVVKQQEKIRKNNDDVVYVYIFRKTKNDPTKMEFVSDSHSINPYANTDADSKNDVDADMNGKIEPENGDKLQWPGQFYPSPPPEAFLAYEKPIAVKEMHEDSWGNYMSGYGPIMDAQNRVVGILGVDMKAALLNQRTSEIFQPFLYFIGFFFFFVFIRLAAFNKSLLLELWQAFLIKKVLIILTIGFVLFLAWVREFLL